MHENGGARLSFGGLRWTGVYKIGIERDFSTSLLFLSPKICYYSSISHFYINNLENRTRDEAKTWREAITSKQS